MVLLLASPWFYGSAPWISQYFLNWGLFAGSLAILLYVLIAAFRSGEIPGLPVASWFLLGLFAIAAYQTSAQYELLESSHAPPSVQVQRWALGISSAPPPIDGYTLHPDSFVANQIPCDLQSVASSPLTRSIEPLHSRGAMVSLLLCALLCWCGAAFFSSRQGQFWLFLTITFTGVAVAAFGIQGALSYKEANILGLRTGGSFASFQSKNSAGGFLNIALAGAIGLFAWTLIHLKRKKMDVRYRVSEENTFMKLKGAVEDFFADLNTAQIASLLCLVLIVVALLMSLCRGAMVAAVVAVVGASMMAHYKSRGRGGAIVSALLIFVSVGGMVALQVDEDVYGRLQSLAEFDLEEDAINGRTYIWGVAWKAMLFYGWLGSGLGTFHFAYLPFQDPSSPGWFYHPESLFFQCAVDLGWFGLLLMILGIFASFLSIQRRVPGDVWKYGFPMKLAGGYLLISQCAHSAVDFAMIVPALFLPTSILLGAASASLRRACAMSSKYADKRGTLESMAKPIAKPRPWGALVSISGLALLSGAMAWRAEPDLANLAASESMEWWVKGESRKPIEEQSPDRYRELISQWQLGADALKNNPLALRLLADACLYDFQRNQMNKAPGNVNWQQVWHTTDPLLLQIGLDRSTSTKTQEILVEQAGGKPAVERLEQASLFYARSQWTAPLDWRACWGRCLATLQCSRDQMSRLISPVDMLGRHVPKQMINSALLFRQQLTDEQLDTIWKQSMRTKPSSSIATARNLLVEREPEKIDISIFPPRSDILQSLARSVFTKEKYPDLNRQLWELAVEKFDGSQLPIGKRELWLADASRALEKLDQEIEHLKGARRFMPTDVSVGLRLANCYLENQDPLGAEAVAEELIRLAPSDPTVQSFRNRLRAYRLR
ncbi:O-antigen ligase family protein [Pirellula sp. SH-Sr6A]|uniref:O-antigen ligase family protein n=1 Tax=Pirellula sp. SH-Sr6A TaxID=1632865 RepID=UPI00143BE826|nr:O-antigen ligase family protein [Pirellula sp. SH-Sr6A]